MNSARYNPFVKRLAQVRASLISEGYVVVGGIGDSVFSLRHPGNGNRITLIASCQGLAMMKNGRLIKNEGATVTATPST